MAKDKYDFIQELLENNKLTPTQKERVFMLTSAEIRKDKEAGGLLEERVKKLEDEISPTIKNEVKAVNKKIETGKTIGHLNQKMNTNEFNFVGEKNIAEGQLEPENLPKYINPFSKKGLTDFLVAYNQNQILKYTCHTVDSQSVLVAITKTIGLDKYDFQKHQEVIVQNFTELAADYFVNPNLKNLILVYLTGKTYSGKESKWSSEEIGENWGVASLQKWSNEFPGLVPNAGPQLQKLLKNKGYKLNKSFISKYTGKRISYFSDLTLHFKTLFHINSDNNLKDIITNINKLEKFDKEVNFIVPTDNFRETIELFTDVDKLVQSYHKIIEIILDVSKKKKFAKPEIVLTFLETKKNVIEFGIHHINSPFYQKSPTNVKNRIGASQNELITNQINGLCNLYLNANFENGESYIVNLWDGKPRDLQPSDKINGVKYILRFTQ